jgi:hypothetical protein
MRPASALQSDPAAWAADEWQEGGEADPLRRQLGRIAGWLGSFAVAAAGSIAPMLNASYVDAFNAAHLSVVLVILLGFSLLRYPRIPVGRELILYVCLLVYMAISAMWTPGIDIAGNTLVPAVNFLLILMLFGSLAMFHDLGAVFAGMVFGFWCGAGSYTVITRFPFARPDDFSYNAIAGMYLFGLFSILLWGWHTRRRLTSLMMAAIAMILIAATTSIKTNLGVLLGAVAAALIYFTAFMRILGRSAIALMVICVAVGFAIASNDALLEQLQDGLDRVTTGAQILGAREDNAQGTSFNERRYWQKVGLEGWAQNPVFGSGVEAFRKDIGITSHSTPIDLLYNHGLIGFVLFYALFGSLVWSLYATRRVQLGTLPILIFSGVVCYGFMSLSEPLHYSDFFAIFVAVTSTLLRRESSCAT